MFLSCSKESLLNPQLEGEQSNAEVQTRSSTIEEKGKESNKSLLLVQRLRNSLEYKVTMQNLLDQVGQVNWGDVIEDCHDDVCTYVVGTTEGKLRFFPSNLVGFKVWFEKNTFQDNGNLVQEIYYLVEDNNVTTIYEPTLNPNEFELKPGNVSVSISDAPIFLLTNQVGNLLDVGDTPIEISWWACLTKCNKVASDACDGDAECKLLCDVADIVGLCTGAIVLSCGVACL